MVQTAFFMRVQSAELTSLTIEFAPSAADYVQIEFEAIFFTKVKLS